MKTFKNNDEQTHYVAMGSEGTPILVTDVEVAKELFRINNLLKNATNELNDPHNIMDDEWRETCEANRDQLIARRKEIVNAL